jgi:hypothetical protein
MIVVGSSMLVWKACAIHTKGMLDLEGIQAKDDSPTCCCAKTQDRARVIIGKGGGEIRERIEAPRCCQRALA